MSNVAEPLATTLTLPDFLLRCIAEDEEAARVAEARQRPVPATTNVSGVWLNSRFHMTVPPARVLAECEAKRRIVHLHSGPDYWESPDYHLCVDSMTHNEQCDTLRALALPYADHEDYRDEWRP